MRKLKQALDRARLEASDAGNTIRQLKVSLSNANRLAEQYEVQVGFVCVVTPPSCAQSGLHGGRSPSYTTGAHMLLTRPMSCGFTWTMRWLRTVRTWRVKPETPVETRSCRLSKHSDSKTFVLRCVCSQAPCRDAFLILVFVLGGGGRRTRCEANFEPWNSTPSCARRPPASSIPMPLLFR